MLNSVFRLLTEPICPRRLVKKGWIWHGNMLPGCSLVSIGSDVTMSRLSYGLCIAVGFSEDSFVSLRDKLNANPVITTVAAIVILVAAGVFIVMRATHTGPSNSIKIPTKDYYSDDDGKTWFVDSADLLPPFDHNGNKAYGVLLFRCGTGKPFVQRLIGYDPSARQMMEERTKQGVSGAVAKLSQGVDGQMIKRPGDADWVTLTDGNNDASKKWQEINQSFPPCSEGAPTPVSPSEEVLP